MTGPDADDDGGAVLVTRGLAVGHPGRAPVAAGLDLRVPGGTLVCLLGRNGAGKTTLLRTLAGLLAPRAGSVCVAGAPLHALGAAERARRVAVVLTDRVEAPGLGVRDVVELGRQPHTPWTGRLGAADRAAADAALRAADADHLDGRAFDALSDGERQRVLVARALAQDPRLLLLDEVTAFLDLPARVAALTLLRRVARERGCAVVLSSHDLEVAVQLADRLWLLPGDGALVDDVPEAVALGGHLGRAFDQPAVRFSLARGAFELADGGGPRVLVAGDEPGRAWTARALRRSGFTPVETAAGPGADPADPTAARVVVERAGAGWAWHTTPGDGRAPHRAAALGEALQSLRALGAAAPGVPPVER